jgi:hypothetical protein
MRASVHVELLGNTKGGGGQPPYRACLSEVKTNYHMLFRDARVGAR